MNLIEYKGEYDLRWALCIFSVTRYFQSIGAETLISKMSIHRDKNLLKSIWKKRKSALVLQAKRIFLCKKEKYTWFKCLLLYFKYPLL